MSSSNAELKQEYLNLIHQSSAEFDKNLERLKQLTELLSKETSWVNEFSIESFLNRAILANQSNTLRFFLEQGIVPSEFPRDHIQDSCMPSLLYTAITCGNLAMVKLLNEYGTDIDPIKQIRCRTKNENKAIELAVNKNFPDMVDYLLEHGAQPDYAMIWHAIRENKTQILESLITYEDNLEMALHNASNDKKNYPNYALIINTLMDYAVGVDLHSSAYSSGLRNYELKFLQKYNVDVSYMNFIGISINNEPITREMLIAKKLKGAEKALITLEDLQQLPDPFRKTRIEKRLEEVAAKRPCHADNNGRVVFLPKPSLQEGEEIRLLASKILLEKNPAYLIPYKHVAQNPSSFFATRQDNANDFSLLEKSNQEKPHSLERQIQQYGH